MEAHYAVPPVWRDEAPEEANGILEMVGSGMRHPQCPNQWCPTQHSVKWSGPGEEGFWIDPTFEKHPFHPKPTTNYHEEL